MRIGVPILILGFALSACATATDPLPPAFDGAWDLTPAACADPDGLSRLGIAGATLQYYEWGGNVLSARSDGDGPVRVVLDWWDTSDTDANEQPITRRRTGELTLSPDRSTLQIVIDGEATSYVRCPAAPR
ncbi:hypothetical protein [Brevundimonas sp.]|uniref:hypothetical protein n=1 Tax=Brevundimonas sp. TaxID=1871086 RepID=UPI002D424F78|nr:hypothetical protein [Brevundimonas sp.]HYC97937.1 hypothetical protein [Brevundimonas sp.]